MTASRIHVPIVSLQLKFSAFRVDDNELPFVTDLRLIARHGISPAELGSLLGSYCVALILLDPAATSAMLELQPKLSTAFVLSSQAGSLQMTSRALVLEDNLVLFLGVARDVAVDVWTAATVSVASRSRGGCGGSCGSSGCGGSGGGHNG